VHLRALCGEKNPTTENTEERRDKIILSVVRKPTTENTEERGEKGLYSLCISVLSVVNNIQPRRTLSKMYGEMISCKE
jgi:hypothetical protein